MNIPGRISALRNAMQEKNLQAYIVTGTDPHMCEYLPLHWKEREWISGFTGSSGTVVVTIDKAGLWTDSRYFLQAAQQLQGTGIELFKTGLPGTPTFQNWLKAKLKSKARIGYNYVCMPLSLFRNLKNSFDDPDLKLVGETSLIDGLWTDRPEIPSNPVFAHDTKYSGKSRQEKLQDIRREMEKAGANFHFVGNLDDIAWIFNIRGNDIEYNPVVTAYALLSTEQATLYVNEAKMPSNLLKKLAAEGIKTAGYEQIFEDLEKLPASADIMLDATCTNQKIYNKISVNIIEKKNPSQLFRSCKNTTEIKNIRNVMRKDGVALTRFFFWLEQNIGKQTITEISVMKKLREFRAQQDDFISESFNSIVGYGGNGAIVHYAATTETNTELRPKGFVLIDSGAHYLDGTTDTTRTIALGSLRKEEKMDFTLVLKGMIQLSMAKFPVGTRGCNLDVLARQALWEHGRNYGHGTGHGVGYFLNVHEGPQSIRQEIKEQAVLPGMVTSNEPGLYREGKYGIRHENLILCKEAEKTEFGDFLCFETLTLCYFDTRALLPDLLSEKERTWLNDYHQMVFNALAPDLDEIHRNWLHEKTKAI